MICLIVGHQTFTHWGAIKVMLGGDPSFAGVKHKVSGSTQTWAAWEATRGDSPTVPMEATFEITLRADRNHPMRVTVRPPGTLMAPKRHQQVIRRWLAHAGLLVVDGADG